MECPQCLKCYEEADFFGKLICYRCVYKNKIVQSKKKYCQQCLKELPKSRWKYCSKECGELALKKQAQDYWVRQVTSEKVRWN